LCRGLDDNREHTLYLDISGSATRSSGHERRHPPPQTVTVRSFEQHIAVSWQASDANDLLSYRIQRSTDERRSRRSAPRPVDTPVIGTSSGPGKQAWYRVTALDIAANESPPSPSSPPAKRAR